MATQPIFRSNETQLLRIAVRANSIFCTVCGVTSMLAAVPLAQLMGIAMPQVLVGLGIVLVVYGVWLFFQTTREVLDRRVAVAVIVLDVLWVIESIIILLIGWPPLTTAGKQIVTLLAVIVAGFAEVQFIGLRRVNRRSNVA